MHKSWSLFAVFFAVSLSLGACVNTNKQGPCPTYGILADAEVFVGETGGTAFRSTITDIGSTCSYHGANKPIKVKLDLAFDVELSSETNTKLVLPYFVAVTQGEEMILARELFEVRVPVKGKSGKRRERVEGIKIPLAEGYSGAAYDVIVGFELTPAQATRIRTEKKQNSDRLIRAD